MTDMPRPPQVPPQPWPAPGRGPWPLADRLPCSTDLQREHGRHRRPTLVRKAVRWATTRSR